MRFFTRFFAAAMLFAASPALDGGPFALTDDGGYTIDHTASAFLMDEEGQFAGTLSYGEEHDSMLEKLKRLAKAV